MPGYFNERLATDIKDKIYAKAIVVEGGNGEKVAMIAVEANFITEQIANDAKERIAAHSDIKPENVTMSATHIHNGGPTVDWGKLVKHSPWKLKFAPQTPAQGVMAATNICVPQK